MDTDLFENELAPAIIALLERCAEAGIPFIAVFQARPQGDPECLRSFAWLPPDRSVVAQTILRLRRESGAPFPENREETNG